MGFVTGFTGGVTLTLTAAYLSALVHQRKREEQGSILRAQALAIQDLIDPVHPPLPPTRSELAAAERAHSLEAVKDRWNSEVENAAKWVQRTDWDEVRETAEASVARLWTKAFGEAEHGAEKAQAKLQPLGQQAKAKAQQAESSVAAVAKSAYEQAKQRTQEAEAIASQKAYQAGREARTEASHVRAAVQDKKSEAKGWLSSAMDKGKEMVGVANVPTGVADVELATGIPGAAVTPVEKALQQRYQRPEAKNNKTVAAALKERYTPMDQRDNTVLRGI